MIMFTILSDYKESMKDVYSSSVSSSTVDESPFAYKDHSVIESAIEPNARIVAKWKSVWNFKASE